MRIWTEADAAALCALVDLTLPGEGLSPDELVAACFEDAEPATVIGLPDGEGAVAAVVRDPVNGSDQRVAHLLLLVVEPAAQGQGKARRLLAAAEDWAFDAMGAAELHAGGGVPFGLWPGVDVRWTRSLCLFEGAGYEDRGMSLVLSCPSTHRAAPPGGVEVRRVLEDADAEAVSAWSARHAPGRRAEVARAVDNGSCFVAITDRDVAGVVCHSVSRTGWIGPLGVGPDHRRKGIGRALLGAACGDLRAAGLPDVQIATPAPIEFFARAAGASVSRVFRRVARGRD